MIKCFPLARCRFWIVTCCFLLVPATCSVILCVCVWGGVVYILDRNMVFSLGVGSIFNYFVHVRMVRCAFLERNDVCSCGGGGICPHSSLLHSIIFFFGAGHRKSYWNGCIKVAIVICQQIFSDLALVIFLKKNHF